MRPNQITPEMKSHKNLVVRAASQDSVDDAARIIQDALGIETGDTASHMLSADWRWQQLYYEARIAEIRSWLSAECMAVVDLVPYVEVSTVGD